MASSRRWIDAAFSCTTSPYALSYADPNQKWIIREHLLTLLQDFPSLRPSIDTFTDHNNGASVTLLKANGEILIPPYSTLPIVLTIWIHDNYPIMPPSVYISSNSLPTTVYFNHPFLDSSGALTSYYLQNWQPGCNLSDMVRNLVKLFSCHHPFCYSPSSSSNPSIVSKREAVDRLALLLYYDMVEMGAKTEKEIEACSALQPEMVKRFDIATSMVIGLEQERKNLKERVKKLDDDADVLLNWLKIYDKNPAVLMMGDDIDDAFEVEDEKSKLILNYLAADKAMEDLLYALDLAVQSGVLDFEIYIKQVRRLARTQFLYRSKVIKLDSSSNYS